MHGVATVGTLESIYLCPDYVTEMKMINATFTLYRRFILRKSANSGNKDDPIYLSRHEDRGSAFNVRQIQLPKKGIYEVGQK